MDATQAIDPFPTPAFFALNGGGIAGMSDLLPVIFAFVFFLWVAYTFVVGYHWFRYGHLSMLAVPMLAVHIVVSGTLMLLATVGLR